MKTKHLFLDSPIRGKTSALFLDYKKGRKTPRSPKENDMVVAECFLENNPGKGSFVCIGFIAGVETRGTNASLYYVQEVFSGQIYCAWRSDMVRPLEKEAALFSAAVLLLSMNKYLSAPIKTRSLLKACVENE